MLLGGAWRSYWVSHRPSSAHSRSSDDHKPEFTAAVPMVLGYRVLQPISPIQTSKTAEVLSLAMEIMTQGRDDAKCRLQRHVPNISE
jgi:hypothetical protein